MKPKDATKIFYNSINKLNPLRIKQEWIDFNYSDFNDIQTFTLDIREKIYAIDNDLSERPKCSCGNELKFIKISYNKYCSKKCSIEHRGEDTKKAIQEKYGVDNYYSTEVFQKKRKASNLDIYGVEHHMQVNSIRDKVLSNRDEEQSQNTREQTLLHKYNVRNVMQLLKVKDKIRGTKLQRYGSETYNNIDKQMKTSIERHGKYHTTSHILNIEDITEKYFRENFIKDSLFLAEGAKEYFNIGKTSLSYFKIRFDITEQNKRDSFRIEQNIGSLIKESIINTRNIISPLELDVYSEKHSFAIEYNGLVWHSQGISKHSKFNTPNSPKNYHLRKTEMCENKSIQLFHIFENEWLDSIKRDIWISMINGKQGLHKKLGARKCTIKEVQSKEARKFLEENHMQGSVPATTRVALIYDDTIVSLMTFGKARISKNYQYELYRFCTKKNLTVQGAGSRMLKYFEERHKPKSLVSYANRRWSQGNFYEKVGFAFSHNSGPNMFWFKAGSMKLESRQKYQKHKLKDIEGFIFDETKTAKENMFLNDYRVIYDSGNKIYLKEYNEED